VGWRDDRFGDRNTGRWWLISRLRGHRFGGFGGFWAASSSCHQPPSHLEQVAVAKAANRLLRARPDFLIIGTQKACTTSLFNYLATHPEISPAAKKEIHFFNIYKK